MDHKPTETKDVTPVNDTLEDLLNNPFSTPTDTLTTSQQAEIDQLQEQQTAARLIDKLPAERQEQAKQLAAKSMPMMHSLSPAMAQLLKRN